MIKTNELEELVFDTFNTELLNLKEDSRKKFRGKIIALINLNTNLILSAEFQKEVTDILKDNIVITEKLMGFLLRIKVNIERNHEESFDSVVSSYIKIVKSLNKSEIFESVSKLKDFNLEQEQLFNNENAILKDILLSSVIVLMFNYKTIFKKLYAQE